MDTRAAITSSIKYLALWLIVFMMTATSHAAQFNLTAGAVSVTMPDGVSITMWGFGLDGQTPTVPGPLLTVPPGDTTLTINLTNSLPEPVSIVIPGQPMVLAPVKFSDASGRSRVRSFTTETAPGATQVYSWTGLKPGTYLYQSGTHPAVQVQMGLYGGLKKDFAVGQAYDGVAYDNEVVLLYSEIDTALHAAVADGTYGTSAYPSTIDYAPGYFLINGRPYPDAAPILDHNIGIDEWVLIRFLNAGLMSHVPTIRGPYMKVVSEDGNLYPYPKTQYSVLLAAGKTADALLPLTAEDVYPIYDRRLYLTNADGSPGGMLVYLAVSETCPGDFDQDRDVDGVDLFTFSGQYMAGTNQIDLATFAGSFGRIACP